MELLEQFVLGNLEAFEALFREFQRDVYGWILRIVRDPAAAEDLTVETFWRIYRSHGRFDPAQSFGAWVRRIATNVALDYLRKMRRARVEVALPDEISHGEPPNPALRRETREQIARCFRRLPAKLQVVATLALIEERSHEEIADALGISRAAVKLRAFRAVRKLRVSLARAGVQA
jgi:RNA polymerase sigma-70 factor (ECF subfamily)